MGGGRGGSPGFRVKETGGRGCGQPRLVFPSREEAVMLRGRRLARGVAVGPGIGIG